MVKTASVAGQTHRFNRHALALFVMAAFGVAAPQALAGPSGGAVVGGNGSISQSGSNTTIQQNSQNMAIDWQSYNVNVDERVQYLQPNASAVSLNRILSQNGSTIAGRIDANGQVILVNPNGIFFTPTSIINVGGIIASGLDMQPLDFMNGQYIFNEVLGTDGVVMNSGMINASMGEGRGGNVALIGKQVENDGVIVANLGSVTLAAGKQAVLSFDQGGLLGVRVSEAILQDELGVDPAVINSGEILAEGGRVLLTASTSHDIFSQAVNSGGLESATSVVMHDDGSFTLGGGADVLNSGNIDVSMTEQYGADDENVGRIVLLGENVTSSGELRADAASGNGGEIELHAQDTTLLTDNSITSARAEANGMGGIVKVLGDKVGLFDQAQVDVSGANGGGEALVGGDYRGENEQIRNASGTFVGSQAQIHADATDHGDGGRIIIWGNDSARVYGSLNARGIDGGNGGFVETSAAVVDLNPMVDVSTPNGNPGVWLIDPRNITISNSGNSIISETTPGSPDTLFTATTNNSNLRISSLLAALDNRSVTVVVETTIPDGDTQPEPTGGNITIADPINLNGQDINNLTLTDQQNGHIPTLELRAHHDIIIDAAIFDSNTNATNSNSQDPVNLLLLANSNFAEVDNGGGDVVINADISTSGGWVNARGDNINITTNADIDTSGAAFLQGGNIDLMANTGAVTAQVLTTNGGEVLNRIGTNAGNITIQASGQVTVNGGISAVGSRGRRPSGVASVSGGDGGIVQITSVSSTVEVGAIDTTGGDGDAGGDDPAINGGNANTITLTGTEIILNQNISAVGGDGAQGGPQGNGATVTFNGPTTLANDITIDARGATRGAINFNGTLDGATARIENLTLYGNAINFTGLAGSGDRLGDLLVDATGAMDASTITANSVTINQSTHFISGTIDTSGTGNTGGIIDITADQITLNDDLNASGTTTHGAINLRLSSAGSVTLARTTDFTSAVTLTGSDGTDTLNAANRPNNWVLASANSTLNSNFTFSNVETLMGNAQNDHFTLPDSGVFSGTLNGGDGVNDNDTVQGGAQPNTWNITADGVGTVSSLNGTFNGIETLTGGTDVDTFNIESNFTGTINGGLDTGDIATDDTSRDHFNFEAGIGNTFSGRVNGGKGDDTFTINGTGITFANTLNGGAGSGDTLVGADEANYWLVSGVNSGERYASANDRTNVVNPRVSFSDIENLSGNDDIDDFLMGTTGSINQLNGGAGVNTLTARDGANTWTLSDAVNSLEETAASTYVNIIQQIDTLTGGSFVDIFNIGAGASIDTLNALGGDDQFIVNGSVTTLNGGDGLDTINVNAGGNVTILNGDADLDTITIANGATVGILNGQGGNDLLTVNGTVTTLNGGEGLDTINVNAGGDVTTLNGDGDIDTITVRGSGVTSLGSVATLNGGAGDDVINIEADGRVTTALNGNGGADAITVNAIDAIHYGEVAALNGDAAGDTIIVNANGRVTGAIMGQGGGDVITINGRAGSVDGGTAGDSLFITDANSVTGLIDGGTGEDSLTISGADVAIILGSDVDRVETITAGGGSNRLTAANNRNEWLVNATGNTVTDTVTSAVTNFTNFSVLNAGTAGDDFSITAAGIATINGNIGSDEITLANAGIVGTVNGGDGVDSLAITNGNNLWKVDVNDDGEVANIDNLSINTLFTAIETRIGSIGGTNNIDLSAFGSDTINLVDYQNFDLIVGSGTGTLQGVDGSLQNDWSIQTVAYSGDASVGVDDGTVTIGSVTTQFINFMNLSGSDANDNFEIKNDGALTGTIDGGGGTNTLTGANVSNTWNVTGPDAGSLVYTTTETTPTTTFFDNIQTITGGVLDDGFNLLAAGFAGLMAGGDGADSLIIAAAAGDQTIELGDRTNSNLNVHQVETITANAASSNTLISDSAATTNTWSINGARSGTVSDGSTTTTFSNVNDVRGGGTASDDFTLSANGFAGLIDGGAGTDSLMINVVGNRTIELGNRVNANQNIFQVEDIAANAATSNTLVSDSDATTNTWAINGARSGTVSDGSTTTTFSNVNNVRGGTAVDNFTLVATDFTGLIDGGAGTDSLVISVAGDRIIELGNRVNANQNVFQIETLTANALSTNELIGDRNAATNEWTISGVRNGEVFDGSTRTAYSNIDQVTGGASVDEFDLATNDYVGLIDGGAGTDSLVISVAGDRIIELGNRVNTNQNVFQIETLSANMATSNTLISDSDATTNIWAINGARSGTVSDGSTTTTFSNVNNVRGGTAVDNFTLVAADFAGLIDGGVGTDSLVISVAGDRVIELGNRVNANQNVFQIETLAANEATSNTLISDSGATTNTWAINGARSGTVSDGTTTITFSNVNNVRGGGTASDDFTLSANGFAGLIDGGAGTDSLMINVVGNRTIELGNRVNANQNIFQVEDIAANAATSNTLVSDSDATTNTWGINGARSGTVSDGSTTTTFSNVNDVRGGTTTDNFVLAVDNFLGLIDGGDGSDSLVISAAGDRTIELGGRVNANQNVFQIETLTANAATSNTLISDSDATTNTWAINGARSGTVSDGSTTTTFSNVNDVRGGGTASDDFTLSANDFAGLIDGGAGTNSLVISVAGDRMIELGNRVNANQNVFQVEALTGNALSRNELISDSDAVTNEWEINGARNGEVFDGSTRTVYSNIDQVTGGASVDEFDLATNDYVGLVDGGTGSDSLVISVAGDRIIELGDRLNDNQNVFQIETLTANVATSNTLISDSAATTNTWAINGARSGTVSDGSTTTTFSNVNNLRGGGTASDDFTLSANDFAGLIDGGAGTDSLVISVAGGRTIELGDRVNANQNVFQVEDIAANAATRNTLISDSDATTNTWEINGARSGEVSDGTATTTFSNVNNVRGGGTASDDFTLSANNFAGLIDGGAGTDSLVISVAGDRTIELGNRANTNQNVFRIETLTANALSTNELIGDRNAATNEWTISGARNGDVSDGFTSTAYSNIDQVTGGSRADNFDLATNDYAGVIHGGGGSDELIISVSGNQRVEIGNRNNGNVNVFQVETIIANETAIINELIRDSSATTSTWAINGSGTGTLNDGSNNVTFSHFTDLTGAGGSDNFTITGDETAGVAGVIDGMGGNDTLNVIASGDRVIAIGDRSGGALADGRQYVYRLETVTANNAADNELVSDRSATANSWIVTSTNSGSVAGSVNPVSFNNFATLSEGGASGNFTVNTGAGVDVINGGNGSDTFTLFGSVGSLNAGDENDMVTLNNGGSISTLFAGDGRDTITLNSGGSITVLNGGNGNDTVTLNTGSSVDEVNGNDGEDRFFITGNLSNAIFNGGAGNDDFSVQDPTSNEIFVSNVRLNGDGGDDSFVVGALTTATGQESSLTITGGENSDSLGSTLPGFELTLGDSGLVEGVTASEIEEVSAADGILNARNGTTTTWNITGQNSGHIADTGAGGSEAESLTFTGFVELNGGDGVDTFNVSDNGSVAGTISGGDSADALNINLDGRTQTGQIMFDGGDDDDVITLSGSANNETYTPGLNFGAHDQLAYESNGVALAVNYRAVETVTNEVVATNLTVNGSGNSDVVRLGNSVFGANSGLVDVSYIAGNKTNITVRALGQSDLSLTDAITIAGDLRITADVVGSVDPITANRLILDGVNQAGSETNGLMTDVSGLSVVNHSGQVFVVEQDTVSQDGIDFTEVSSTGGMVSVSTIAGSITSDAALSTGGGFRLDAADDIILNGNSQFSGETTFDAGGSIDLTGNNQFASTTLNAADRIDFNGNNSFSGNTTLSAVNTIASTGANVIAAPMSMNATNISLTGNNEISGAVTLNGEAVEVNNRLATNLASVTANDLTIDSLGSIIGTGAIVVSNGSATGLANLRSSTGSITLNNADNNFDVVNMHAANDASLTESDVVTITDTAVGGALNVTSAGDMSVGDISAANINLRASNGAIIDSASALSASSVTLAAANGIGGGAINHVAGSEGFTNLDTSGAINTRTATLSAINTTGGTVNINNSGDVSVHDLRNRGDIILSNAGDISLQVTQHERELVGAIDANYGGDVSSSVYPGSVAILNDSASSVTRNGAGIVGADITAQSLFVNGVTNFGTNEAPIRLRVNDQFTLIASRGVVQYFGGNPRNITTSADLIESDASRNLGGQQIVNIDSLASIDPAVFSEVRNYNYGDTAVRLPADQNTSGEADEDDDEEEDEDEGEETAEEEV